MVNLKETPITHLTEKGIVTADGTLHELDVLICATGFDAVDGNYKRVDIRGRNGQGLRDHWADGPTSYLGVATTGFPNMFMILGPNGPFTNLPPTIETQVEWIADTIRHLASSEVGWLEVKPDVETAWTEICTDIADQTLFPKAASWIFGANIPGKKRTVMFYLGGMKEYRSITSAEAAAGYPGFVSSADVLAEA
jgi:cation diffusion facilitator CzcD-associated flavoprotein CzcO